MRGMSNINGKTIDGLEHLRQSIADILATPIGSRVISRDYGSNLFDLIDKPINATTRIQIQTAALDALAKWEPRITVDQFTLIKASPGGVIEFTMHATYRATGESLTLTDTVTIGGGA